MSYTIAIVDDEPNLVEALYDLLSSRLPYDIEILRAYSATEFCNLLIHTTVDLAISDILMPGISGIDMLNRVENLCPNCRIIFLTGYEKFAWAQEALRHPCCVDYLLKTAGFDTVVDVVTKQLTIIDAQNSLDTMKKSWANAKITVPNSKMQSFRDWIEGTNILPPAGIDGGEEKNIIMFLCKRTRTGNLSALFPIALEKLFLDNFTSQCAIYVINFDVEEYLCLAQFNDISDEQPLGYFIRARIEHIQETLEGFHEKVDIVYHTDPCATAGVPILFMQLQKQLHNKYAEHSSAIIDCTRTDKPLQPDHSLIEQICEYIVSHLSDHNLSVALLAAATYYSPAHLNRLFKKEKGLSVSDYIIQTRMQAACRYLADSTYDISEIGKKLGFESPSYFGVVFKRNMGVTPSDWRHGKRKDNP